MKPSAVRILFIGESWQGSSARSMRESLSNLPDCIVDDINEDLYRPSGQSLAVRVNNRLMTHFYRKELSREIFSRIKTVKPDVIVVYKGNLVTPQMLTEFRRLGIKTANIFPDYSPHAYGKILHRAMGEYDLVVSTKPFHPKHWRQTYGYSNTCVCVPHGYDPTVHYWSDLPQEQSIDVVLAASWRPQYEKTLIEMKEMIKSDSITVALAGHGWKQRSHLFPDHWLFTGGLYGRAYGEFVRKGRIVIAPVHSEVIVRGVQQPGDEDTTRTYELAAAGVFFLHRRTPYIKEVYVEGKETILWSDTSELVDNIRRFLPLDSERSAIAFAAHRRAVPSYSISERAKEVLKNLQQLINMN